MIKPNKKSKYLGIVFMLLNFSLVEYVERFIINNQQVTFLKNQKDWNILSSHYQ